MIIKFASEPLQWDHVVLSYQSCGRCRQCRSGHPTSCERFREANFGFERLDGSNAMHRSGVRGHFFGQSSFATHALATKRNLVKVPKDLPLEMLAPLGCGMQTGAGTVMNSLAVSKGASIVIFGTGAVGLAAVMAARIVGAHPITFEEAFHQHGRNGSPFIEAMFEAGP
jgi:aryl-alcohol dehydrogenase